MNDFLQFLTQNPVIATAAIIAISVVVIVVAFMFVTAFLQGREITFWPPKIGPKAESTDVSLSRRGISPDKSKSKPVNQKNGPSSTYAEKLFVRQTKDWSSIEGDIAKKIEMSNEVKLIQIKGRELYMEL